MKRKTFGPVTCVLFALLALAGCGGGGSTAQTGTTVGISSGTVTKSAVSASGQQITVNNATYTATPATTVTLNGDPAAPADVKPGMQVTISTDGASGAIKVEIEGELEGMVEQIDAPAGQFTVMGQQVVVTDQTVFSGVTGFAALTAGRMVEVHGLPSAAGAVAATRVEVKPATRSAYLSGPISTLDSSSKTFAIRAVVIDYSSATLPSQPLTDGLVVTVKGIFANGVLTASGIRVRHSRHDHGRVELEGLVAGYDALAGTFTLNGQPVRLTTATVVSHGTISDLADGVKVEVKGEVANGVLSASTLEIDTRHGIPVPGPLNGAALYAIHCARCHDPLASSPKKGAAALQIQNAIALDSGGMGGLRLTTAEIDAIAAALSAPVPPPAPVQLTVATVSLPGAVVGAAYRQSLTAVGGVAPYQWRIASGALPDGLTLSALGMISGTPTVAGSFSVTITVADAAVPVGSAAKTLSVVVAAAVPAPLPGKVLYDTTCAGCHRLGTYDAAGSAPNLSGRGGAVVGKLTGGHKGISLSSQQMSDLTAFISTN